MAKRGRPIGSKNRPQFKDYITEDEVKDLVRLAKTQAKTRPEILKFVLEQVFGKAPQPVDANVVGTLHVEISEVIAKKHDIKSEEHNDSHTSANGDSAGHASV